MKKITLRQAEILKFISSYIKNNGYSPCVEDIRLYFGFKSPNAVTCHLKSLIRKGYLSKELNKARSLKINLPFFVSGIPVLGKIAAGKPIIVEDFSGDFLFSQDEIKDVFALKVKGDSMQDAHIYDGDYVIVRKNIEINNGDIVAALVGEEATVKYFKKVRSKIFLVPANPSYEIVEIKENFIVGKVIGVYRKIK
ncbi:MAG: transcriptional repressor LexA [Candidatus Omnitrophica bacterium]|nr:transcriptional repressor LexA [Candidatus Omnitrophota bacterium]